MLFLFVVCCFCFLFQVYIAELASVKWKGRFGNCNELFQTSGICSSYILGINFGGHKIHYYYTALVAVGVIALFELGMLATYETPRWLFSRKHYHQGINTLKIFRGPDFPISNEVDAIKRAIGLSADIRDQFSALMMRPELHPFILVLFLMFFQQFSGVNVAIFYSSKVFTDAGYNSDTANLITVFTVGIELVIGTIISIFLINSVGMRKLLIISSSGMLISSTFLGVYFFVFEEVCEGNLKVPNYPDNTQYMAIACMVLFIGNYSTGWGPFPGQP